MDDNAASSVAPSGTFTAVRKFHYKRLEKGHIRLLEVKARASPGDSAAPWFYDLQHVPLERAPASTAISYCWGEAGELRPIRILSKVLLVRKNAWDALRSLSIDQDDKWLWIDSICIDQRHVEERNAQVAMMSQIYSSASNVVVWLGHEADEMLRTLEEFSLNHEYNAATIAAEVPHLSRFFQLPYWTRIWIVQEVIFANKLSIVGPGMSLPWDKLEKYFNVRRDVRKNEQGGQQQLGYSPVIPDAERVVESLVWRRHRFRQERIDSLENLLDTYHTSLCRDPRDKIFGLLEIWNRQTDQPFRADYSKNIYEVLMMTYAYIVSTQPLANYPFFCNVLLETLGVEQSTSYLRSWLSPRVRSTKDTKQGFIFRSWNRTDLAVPKLKVRIAETNRIETIYATPASKADTDDLLSWVKQFCHHEDYHRVREELKLLKYVDRAMCREDAEWMAERPQGDPWAPINPWDEKAGARLYIDEKCRLGLVSSSAGVGDFVHRPAEGENLMVSNKHRWVCGRAYQGPYAGSVAETMNMKKRPLGPLFSLPSTTTVKIKRLNMDPVTALVLSVPIPKGIRGVTIM